jgi:hypothetical protein
LFEITASLALAVRGFYFSFLFLFLFIIIIFNSLGWLIAFLLNFIFGVTTSQAFSFSTTNQLPSTDASIPPFQRSVDMQQAAFFFASSLSFSFSSLTAHALCAANGQGTLREDAVS